MGAHLDAVATRERKERAAADWLVVGAARGELLARLSAGLVHEARNPLNAMAIHLEVLADKLRDPETGEVPAALSRNVEAARTQVRRLDELLRRYGEFAAGQGSGDDLEACVRRAVALSEYHLRRAGLTASVAAQQGKPLGQPDAVCHALLELLHLAIERAAPGSELRITARADESGVEVALAAVGEEAKAEERSVAMEAARAIASSLGGEIEANAGETWSWRLRLPTTALVNAVAT